MATNAFTLFSLKYIEDYWKLSVTRQLSSHRPHGQDKTVLSCRRCELGIRLVSFSERSVLVGYGLVHIIKLLTMIMMMKLPILRCAEKTRMFGQVRRGSVLSCGKKLVQNWPHAALHSILHVHSAWSESRVGHYWGREVRGNGMPFPYDETGDLSELW